MKLKSAMKSTTSTKVQPRVPAPSDSAGESSGTFSIYYKIIYFRSIQNNISQDKLNPL
jgi:hypothetical protein